MRSNKNHSRKCVCLCRRPLPCVVRVGLSLAERTVCVVPLIALVLYWKLMSTSPGPLMCVASLHICFTAGFGFGRQVGTTGAMLAPYNFMSENETGVLGYVPQPMQPSAQ